MVIAGTLTSAIETAIRAAGERYPLRARQTADGILVERCALRAWLSPVEEERVRAIVAAAP